MTATKKKKIPIHLSKFIDHNLRNVPYYSQLSNGELLLTREDGTTLQRARRMDEIARILNAIEEEYNQLEGEQKEFIQLYYFSPNTITIDGASHKMYISGRTGKRWKKSFACSIAIRLGWL